MALIQQLRNLASDLAYFPLLLVETFVVLLTVEV